MSAEENQCNYLFQPDDWDPVIDGADSRHPTEEWTCPHTDVEGEEKCCFHLSPEKRNELGITDQAVAEKVVQILSTDTGGTSEFIGATLPELHLEEERLESAHGSSIDFRCCRFEGDVNLNGATIHDDIRFSGSMFDKRLEMQNSSFVGVADFHGCDFNGVVESRYATFGGEALFARADFTYSAYFRDGIEFRDDAVFTKVNFGSNASFRSSQFKHEAYFRDTEFDGDATFKGATFEAIVDFGDSEFIEDAEFVGTTFEENVFFGANGPHSDYGAASFEREAVFKDILAGGRMDFEWTVFQQGLRFDESVLENSVDFTRASIHDHLDFIESESIGQFVFQPIHSGDTPTIFRIRDSTIADGLLAQPLGGESFFHSQGSTIGDIEIMETGGEAYELISNQVFSTDCRETGVSLQVSPAFPSITSVLVVDLCTLESIARAVRVTH